MSDFQAKMKELSEICEKLEKQPTLEESLALYDRGVKLQHEINEELQKMERFTVEVIEPDGAIKPFTSKPTR